MSRRQFAKNKSGPTTKDALLQTLIPDEFAFDLAMNIFTFSPGHGLPIIETHVMEHGALILEGKGVYYLDGEWMEVEKRRLHLDGPVLPAKLLRHRARRRRSTSTTRT